MSMTYVFFFFNENLIKKYKMQLHTSTAFDASASSVL